MAEVLMKDDPSAEAKAWADAKFDTDLRWREYGELHAEAMGLALKGFWLGYATKEGVRRSAKAMKISLGFETASPVERVLIEHAVLCYVRLGMVEHLYSRGTNGSYDMRQCEHYERRLTLAQKRFTRAMTTLERVRVLLARAESARDAAERAKAGRSLALARKAG
jgi:hypothetical protein